jgi:LacI family transcriptional regulator
MLSSALFTFNDTAVINARGALRIAELQVPGDISIIGFNDIQAATFLNPPLTRFANHCN